MFSSGRTFSDFISRHRFIWLILVGALAVAADQSTKMWAQRTLAERFETTVENHTVAHFFAKQEITVIPHLFNFIYKENPAAAFSITLSLPDWFRRPFLLLVSALATLFFLIWYFRQKEADGILLTAFCLIMGGAVGNLIDRATLGYVIDFLDFHLGFVGFPNLHWPTFNIADACIVTGALTILLRSFSKKEPV